MRVSVACLLALLFAPLASAQQPAPQTQPWRLGLGGAYATGYLGLFALHGFPRERLADDELLDPRTLSRYQLVLLGTRFSGSSATLEAVEAYVREGGVALLETLPLPSVQALPGARKGPLPAPNLRFVDSGTPLTAGCPELGVISGMGMQGGSIDPPPNSGVTVLARYTDEGAPKRCRGYFDGLPAIVMARYGKGTIVYCGTSISYAVSLRGRQFEPFLCNLVRYLSSGQVADRMYPGAVDRSELLTLPAEEAVEQEYPRPAGSAAPPPAGFEVLEDAEGLRDFVLTADLPAQASARLLISYRSPESFRELTISGRALTLTRRSGGRSVTLAQGTVPAGARALLVSRRHGLLTVKAGWQPCLFAVDGPPVQGALAVKGLKEPRYQPLAPVSFADDFMRETSSSDEWEQVSGRWQVMAAEGKPDMGANPFDYQVTTTDEALSVTGNWFWSDYACDTAVKVSGEAAGLIVDYQDRANLVMLRLQPGSPGKLQLLRRQAGKTRLLGEVAAPLARGDWHALGLRTSHGTILGLLDGQVRLRAFEADEPLGQIGLQCAKGQANFDDVRVRPWVAGGGPGRQVRELRVLEGAWSNGGGGLLSGTGSKGARLLCPWEGGGDCTATVSVKLGRAAAAGLHLRYADAGHYYLLALVSERGGLRIRAYRQGAPGRVLAERAVSGPADAWHRLSAVVRDRRICAVVDGKPLLNLLDGGPLSGAVGLYARGGSAALFREFSAEQVDSDQRLVDELTPDFAGIIDRHTWAGRSGAWTPDPADLNCLWHSGYFPRAVALEAGIHPAQAPRSRAAIHLSRPREPRGGYSVLTERTWASGDLPVVLTRQGQPVAQATVAVAPGKAYSVGLRRNAGQLLVEVNARPVLAYTDPQPLAGMEALGIDTEGSPLYADDLTVLSTDVHDYTFETAPTDWSVEQGTWEITSRWSCTPGWAWFSGFNQSGDARIRSKQAYAGDQEIVVYVGAKMMPIGDGKYSEHLSDVILGLLGEGAEGGYQFTIGGLSNTWSALRRNGTQVATSDYRLPRAGIHNDWLKITLRKTGDTVSAWAWDTQILQYKDPQPLQSGHVSIGTRNNGILVPRVTIFGEAVP